MTKKMEKNVLVINDNCVKRVKPKLIRDVKTEALLVFARTALERFFKKIEEDNIHPFVSNEEDTEFIYGKLRELTKELQYCVVNVEYLLDLIKNAKTYPESLQLRELAKYEEPLIQYYDAMAKRMEYHFPTKTAFMPEFIVICCLSHWILEEEKPTNLYPFLEEFDFLSIIEKFEIYGRENKKDEKNVVNDMYKISIDIINTLKRTKYKFNKERSSKRKKR